MNLWQRKIAMLKQGIVYTLTKISIIPLDCRSNEFKGTFKSLWRHSHVSNSFEMITEKASEAKS